MMPFPYDLDLVRTIILAAMLDPIDQVCGSSRKDHGRVRSSMVITAVCGRAYCGPKSRGRRAVYEGDDDGIVNTNNRGRVFVSDTSNEKRVQKG